MYKRHKTFPTINLAPQDIVRIFRYRNLKNKGYDND